MFAINRMLLTNTQANSGYTNYQNLFLFDKTQNLIVRRSVQYLNINNTD